MTAVCVTALLLAAWVGQAAVRSPDPAVAAGGLAGAFAIAVAAVGAGLWCLRRPHPPARIQEKTR